MWNDGSNEGDWCSLYQYWPISKSVISHLTDRVLGHNRDRGSNNKVHKLPLMGFEPLTVGLLAHFFKKHSTSKGSWHSLFIQRDMRQRRVNVPILYLSVHNHILPAEDPCLLWNLNFKPLELQLCCTHTFHLQIAHFVICQTLSYPKPKAYNTLISKTVHLKYPFYGFSLDQQ